MKGLRVHVWIMKGIVAAGLTGMHFFPNELGHVSYLINLLWLFAF